MIYRGGIEITNILANAVDPLVQASQIKLKCLRQMSSVWIFWQRQCQMVNCK